MDGQHLSACFWEELEARTLRQQRLASWVLIGQLYSALRRYFSARYSLFSRPLSFALSQEPLILRYTFLYTETSTATKASISQYSEEGSHPSLSQRLTMTNCLWWPYFVSLKAENFIWWRSSWLAVFRSDFLDCITTPSARRKENFLVFLVVGVQVSIKRLDRTIEIRARTQG